MNIAWKIIGATLVLGFTPQILPLSEVLSHQSPEYADHYKENGRVEEPPAPNPTPPHQKVTPPKSQTQDNPKGGVIDVANLNYDMVLVNKKWKLPDNYVPQDLVEPQIPFSFSGDSEKRLLRKEAAEALERLFAKAQEDQIEFAGVSGYRSYQTQNSIYHYNLKTQGEEEANQYSAVPGHSEHQTGLAIDVSSAVVNYTLEEPFGETKEGKWLAAHAADFGFIIRYPKGMEKITGYAYEPWHIRYVGPKVAVQIQHLGITLEEYVNKKQTKW
ncbi:M15 family metallopeptidase [Ammoniphilus resinae]|uniref:D-alanyl-D-alanine carboxypeptidase n=1 Tax=Ammoniphilus resinae TaxID=861532 RepID=A0ABS4GNF3_9BACL|nr:M15 family metallopeptidase [Ammoniphilus resinae]MBP1931647.1 D-alanyl-D-alanine carboxypeptidase [Ammoniphilus resinae]